MGNYSNTKIVRRFLKAGSKGIVLLLLAVLLLSRAKAQPYFNRLYTNHATGSQFTSACPQGSSGGFMVTALAVDSSTGTQGLRTVRFDKEGNIQAGSFCGVPPGFPGKTMYQTAGTACKVNDNRFVQVGMVVGDTCDCLYGFIRVADSNGNTIYYRHIDKVEPSYNRKMGIASVAYDKQNLVALCYFETSTHTETYMVVKFDTMLNALWSKLYTPGSYGVNLPYEVLIDSASYLISGFSFNGDAGLKSYKAQASVLKLDTSGNEQWVYRCPELSNAATNIIRLDDGGYVFATMANAYDKWASLPIPTANWLAKRALIKIDKNGNFEWKAIHDTITVSFDAETTVKLLEVPGGEFLTTTITTDSPGTVYQPTYATIRRYTSGGAQLWQHKYLEPIDTPYHAFMFINQPISTSDGSIVLAGYLDNRKTGAEEPAQRGWIVKLDSSGCMGPGDPQCATVSVDDPLLPDEGFVVYPNPNNGAFSIHTTGNNTAAAVLVYDMSGKALYRSLLQFAGNTSDVNINLPTGVYLLEITSNEGYRQRQRLQIR